MAGLIHLNTQGPAGPAGPAGGVTSVSNSDSSLSISPTTGDVIASINVGHSNSWSIRQNFIEASVTRTPGVVGSLALNFVADSAGFLANGTVYNYYVYAYYNDTGSGIVAYNPIGVFVGATDPNDFNLYSIDLSWSAASDANGYFVFDFNATQYTDVGSALSLNINTSTSWTLGSPPTTPTSVDVSGIPIYVNPSSNYLTDNVPLVHLGDDGSGNGGLKLEWDFAGAGGLGGLRFDDRVGDLKYIIANAYGDVANFGTQVTTGVLNATSIFTTNLIAGITNAQIVFSSSTALIGDSGFTYDSTNNRLLVASSSFNPQSKIHIDSGTSTASELRFTAGSTTGQTSSDGFQVGITSTGIAEIRQRENLALNLYTNNTLAIEATSGQLVGIGTAGTVSAKLHVLSTTEQLRVGYNTSNYYSTTVSSAGAVTFNAVGASAGFTFADNITTNGYINPSYGGHSSYWGAGSLVAGGAVTDLAIRAQTGAVLFSTAGSTEKARIDNSGNFVVGATTASARGHFVSTTEQLRVGYDVSNYVSATVSSTGVVTLDAVGSGGSFVFSDSLSVNGSAKFLSVGQTTQVSNFGKVICSGTSNSTDSPIIYIWNTTNDSAAKNAGIWTRTRMTSRYLYTAQNIGQNDNSFSSPGVIQWTALEYTDSSYSSLATPTEFTGWSYQYYNGSSYTNLLRIHTSGIYIGAANAAAVPAAKLHVISTTEQFRVGYDTSNYYSTTVSSTGAVTFNAVGASAGFSFSDAVTLSDVNLVLGTTTGTKIGTSTTQKLALWNATPIVQPTTSVASATLSSGTGANVKLDDTFDGYTLAQVVKALRNVGVLA